MYRTNECLYVTCIMHICMYVGGVGRAPLDVSRQDRKETGDGLLLCGERVRLTMLLS